MRKIYLIGTADARTRAKHLIYEHIADRDYAERAGPASVSKKMEVPPDLMRYIIGKSWLS